MKIICADCGYLRECFCYMPEARKGWCNERQAALLVPERQLGVMALADEYFINLLIEADLYEQNINNASSANH